MTRKDYVLIATVVKQIKDSHSRLMTAVDFATLLEKDNPRFNTGKFMEACGTASV